jgi:hypothetical protein
MNYKELSKVPNALDILNIKRTMAGAAHFDNVSPIEGGSHLELYINNLNKLYPNITEEELNNIIEVFKANM